MVGGGGGGGSSGERGGGRGDVKKGRRKERVTNVNVRCTLKCKSWAQPAEVPW